LIKSLIFLPYPSTDSQNNYRRDYVCQDAHVVSAPFRLLPPNGLRYRLVGGTRQCHFAGTNFKPRKLPENAQTPTSRVHAVLGGDLGGQDNLKELASILSCPNGHTITLFNYCLSHNIETYSSRGPFGFFPGPESVRVLLLASTKIGDEKIKSKVIKAINPMICVRCSTNQLPHQTSPSLNIKTIRITIRNPMRVINLFVIV